MAEQNTSEELDITRMINKIRKGYHNFLVWLYRVFQFIISSWIIILILIISGAILGYIFQKSELPKETTLLVQINFDSANYVYDVIEQLENKINEKDTILLKEIGLYKKDTIAIKKIEIEPVVDIMEIVRSEKGDERNVEILIQQARNEEDVLTSEIFIPKYKLHKIKILASAHANSETINTLLNFLNKNNIINKIQKTTIESTKKEILQNDQSVSYIDSIVKIYGSRPPQRSNASQIYFNNMDLNNGNVHLLFEQKNLIIEQNDKLKIDLIKYENIVQLMNKPMLQVKKGFFDNKVIAIPILLLFLFLIFAILKHFYNKARGLASQRR